MIPKCSFLSLCNNSTMQIRAHSFSPSGQGFVQIKGEPYLINVQKLPIAIYPLDLLGSNIGHAKNEPFFNSILYLGNVIALSPIASVTSCRLFIVRFLESAPTYMPMQIACTILLH